MTDLASLQKFERIMLFAAFGLPFLVANTNWCPGSLGLLRHIGVFASFVDYSIATPEQICLVEDYWLIYVPSVIYGCFYFRAPFERRIIDYRSAQGMTTDLRESKDFLRRFTIAITIGILLMVFLPDSAAMGVFNRAFEAKKFFFLTVGVCIDAAFIGFVLATWREIPGLSDLIEGAHDDES